ncbi:MAG: rod-binding protein [Candidatus Wallacebacter cryptica]|jgi:flagellar protein FlgJ|nr:hypothetical protein [Bacillota bacterium]
MKVAWDPGKLITDKAQQLSTSQKALKQAAVDFESLFIQQMLKEMRNTVPESDLFGNRNAEKLFQSMYDEQLAIEMAGAGGIGLSDIIYRQMVMYVPDND